MHQRTHRGFTLIELLVVIAIIGILVTFLIGALSAVKKKSMETVAKSHINAIKAALAAYETDMGRYPRLSPIPTEPGTRTQYMDDSPALYAALRNQPGRGGGPNSPYLQDWKHEDIGIWTGPKSNGAIPEDAMYMDADDVGANHVTLSKDDAEQINDLAFQQTHDPTSGDPLVLLDPWGNPFHYREWASVRRSVKNQLSASATDATQWPDPPGNPSGTAVVTVSQQIRARSPEGFDIWSNGANMVNEHGHPDSDDLTSWR